MARWSRRVFLIDQVLGAGDEIGEGIDIIIPPSMRHSSQLAAFDVSNDVNTFRSSRLSLGPKSLEQW
jgi:hypothetical protein